MGPCGSAIPHHHSCFRVLQKVFEDEVRGHLSSVHLLHGHPHQGGPNSVWRHLIGPPGSGLEEPSTGDRNFGVGSSLSQTIPLVVRATSSHTREALAFCLGGDDKLAKELLSTPESPYCLSLKVQLKSSSRSPSQRDQSQIILAVGPLEVHVRSQAVSTLACFLHCTNRQVGGEAESEEIVRIEEESSTANDHPSLKMAKGFPRARSDHFLVHQEQLEAEFSDDSESSVESSSSYSPSFTPAGLNLSTSSARMASFSSHVDLQDMESGGRPQIQEQDENTWLEFGSINDGHFMCDLPGLMEADEMYFEFEEQAAVDNFLEPDHLLKAHIVGQGISLSIWDGGRSIARCALTQVKMSIVFQKALHDKESGILNAKIKGLSVEGPEPWSSRQSDLQYVRAAKEDSPSELTVQLTWGYSEQQGGSTENVRLTKVMLQLERLQGVILSPVVMLWHLYFTKLMASFVGKSSKSTKIESSSRELTFFEVKVGECSLILPQIPGEGSWLMAYCQLNIPSATASFPCSREDLSAFCTASTSASEKLYVQIQGLTFVIMDGVQRLRSERMFGGGSRRNRSRKKSQEIVRTTSLMEIETIQLNASLASAGSEVDSSSQPHSLAIDLALSEASLHLTGDFTISRSFFKQSTQTLWYILRR